MFNSVHKSPVIFYVPSSLFLQFVSDTQKGDKKIKLSNLEDDWTCEGLGRTGVTCTF